jgi:hypothetical protein
MLRFSFFSLMNPLTWLLAKLRHPTTLSAMLSAPTLSPSGLIPVPVSPPAPPTEDERAARQLQREQDFERAFVQEFSQAMQQGHLHTTQPAKLLRAVHLLRHNQADQEQARRHGHWAEQLRLATEAQALEAAAKYHSWRHSLCRDFGQATGTKLSQHQIEPGMTLEMVLAAFGYPTQVPVSAPDNPDLYILRYGSIETGSIVEFYRGVVTRATVGTVAFPEHVYDLPDISGC